MNGNFVIKDELFEKVIDDSFVLILFEDNGKLGIEFVKNNKLASKLFFEFSEDDKVGLYFLNTLKKRLKSNILLLHDLFNSLYDCQNCEEVIFNFFTTEDKYFHIGQIFEISKLANYNTNAVNKDSETMLVEIFKGDEKIGFFQGNPMEGKFFFIKCLYINI